MDHEVLEIGQYVRFNEAGINCRPEHKRDMARNCVFRVSDLCFVINLFYLLLNADDSVPETAENAAAIGLPEHLVVVTPETDEILSKILQKNLAMKS